MKNGNGDKSAISDLKQRIKNYKQALKYLNAGGELTCERLLEANRIAGGVIPEYEIRMMWQRSVYIIGRPGQSGGRERMRHEMRNALSEGIATFKEITGEMEKSRKKWWQVWK